LDYIIDTTTDQLHITGGTALVGKICEQLGFGSASSSISYPETLKPLVGLFVQGRARYEEIDLFRHDGWDTIKVGGRREVKGIPRDREHLRYRTSSHLQDQGRGNE